MKHLLLIIVLILPLAACDEGATHANTGATVPAAGGAEGCDHCETAEVKQVAADCDDCASADAKVAACDACKNGQACDDVPSDDEPQQTVALSLEAPTMKGITFNARTSDWLAPDQRESPFYLDYAALDQDGNAMKLSDLVGKPIVMSFIFTRCGNQRMCPAITLQMANLQRSLEAEDMSDDVRVVLVSYDPVYDTPERLKKYGGTRGFRFTHGDVMLQPDVDDYRDMISELAVAIAPLPDGTFDHAMELLLIDAQGRFVRDYQGDLWRNEPIVEDLKKLVAENTQK